MLTLVVVWLVAIPIGIYSATHQYSFFDYVWTFVGVIGLGTPNFLLALLVMWLAFLWLGISAVGIQSPEFISAPWGVARVLDLLTRIWVPVAVIGLTSTAGLIRIMRGTLLDELKKAYVIVARAKGLSEAWIVFKYSLRIAINPLISTIGWMLPAIFSGEALVSIVMNLHTIGPLPAGGAAQSGHVPGRQHRPDPGFSDPHRYPRIGHHAGLGRSPHPLRAGGPLT